MIISGEILSEKYIVYLLYFEGKIVYIGESGLGIKRCFQHHNKKFDKIEILSSSKNILSRKKLETELIERHNPKYNKKLYFYDPDYISLSLLRKRIKEEGRNDITKTLKNSVIKNCKYVEKYGAIHVNIESVSKYLKLKNFIL